MPIQNNKGHTLNVTTNIAGKLYENEEVTQVYYHGHKRERPSSPPAATMEVFGSNQGQPQAVEVEIDPALEKALNEDLASRGLPQTKRRSRKPKTPKACSQATKTTTDNK